MEFSITSYGGMGETDYMYNTYPRTAIEVEFLYQALYIRVQRLITSLTKCQLVTDRMSRDLSRSKVFH